jgi:hypothetical protein
MIPKIVQMFQKRPSDKTIMIARIIFWLILSLSAYYSLIYSGKEIETTLFFWLVNLSNNWILIIKYIVVLLWLVPIIMWATNLCLLKSKYMRYVQILFWIILFYISWIIKSSPTLWVDTLYWVMWIFPLFAGITWKCITTKCLRYKQKITKIRI